jgi:hypothetical protein
MRSSLKLPHLYRFYFMLCLDIATFHTINKNLSSLNFVNPGVEGKGIVHAQDAQINLGVL